MNNFKENKESTHKRERKGIHIIDNTFPLNSIAQDFKPGSDCIERTRVKIQEYVEDQMDQHNKAIHAEKQIKEDRKALNYKKSKDKSTLLLKQKQITTYDKTLKSKLITFNFKSSDSIKNAKAKKHSNENLPSKEKEEESTIKDIQNESILWLVQKGFQKIKK